MTSTVYVCRRRVTTAVNNTFVDINDVKEFGWVEPLKQLIDDNLQNAETNKIWLMDNLVGFFQNSTFKLIITDARQRRSWFSNELAQGVCQVEHV